jgi:cystathionine beta-lyase/cystathionine gamma-synthase
MESLVTRPAMSSHRGMTPEARRRAGVADGLIRLSVGTEALEDLQADLAQALAP